MWRGSAPTPSRRCSSRRSTSGRRELKGLALSPMPEGLKKANAYVEAGQTVQAVPMAVPADYAAFTVLGR